MTTAFAHRTGGRFRSRSSAQAMMALRQTTPAPPSRSRRGVPASLFAAVVAAGAVVMLVVWWRSATWTAPGALSTNAGRVAGLLAAYGSLVQLTLRARVPAVERGLGAAAIWAWHRRGGRAVVGLAAVHAALVVAGYSMATDTGVLEQLGLLFSNYPGVLPAAAALVLLITVGLMSVRMARGRLRYETWHYLHFYVYLAIALAFAHQVVDGETFRHDAVARLAWTALFVGVAGLLGWHRFLVPVLRALRHRFTVAEVRAEAPDVVSLRIAGRRLDTLGVEPGQYFRWRFLDRDGWWAANPYSLSALATREGLRVTVKAVGDHSGRLRKLQPGTRVIAEGPYGGFTAARRTRPKVLLVAGGIGITPLRTLFEALPGRPGDITLLYRASSAADVVFRDELDALASARGHRVVYLTGPRAEHARALTAAGFGELLGDLNSYDAYVCGPTGLAAGATRELLAAGIGRGHVFTESFRP